MSSSVKFVGLNELTKALEIRADSLEPIKQVIRRNGAQLNGRMQRKAIFRKGYSTGATQQSIDLQLSKDGLTATVGPHTDYAMYLELGTRFMEAQPFVGPALHEQERQFIKDLTIIMK